MISTEINTRYALLPTRSGISTACESACLGYVLGNSGDEEQQNVSVRFLKYMLSVGVQTEILDRTEQIPANPQIDLKRYENEKPRLYQAVKTVLASEHKINLPDNIWNSKQKLEYTDHILKVLSGELDETTFLNLIE